MNIVETRRATSHAEQAKNSKGFKPLVRILKDTGFYAVVFIILLLSGCGGKVISVVK